MDSLKRYIRSVPDYPKPGILFYDITTLLRDAHGFRQAQDGLTALAAGLEIDRVVGIESRGFFFGPHLAYRLGVGFVPVRKPGKLPGERLSASYDLEYGTDAVEMHTGHVEPGDRVLIVDDVVATGGTALASAQLVERSGGSVVGFCFLIELSFLPGRDRLKDYEVRSLLQY